MVLGKGMVYFCGTTSKSISEIRSYLGFILAIAGNPSLGEVPTSRACPDLYSSGNVANKDGRGCSVVSRAGPEIAVECNLQVLRTVPR